MFWLRTKTHNPESLEPPFRSQVLSRDALTLHAADIAERFPHAEEKLKATGLKKRFRENFRRIDHAYFTFSAAARDREVLSAGAEWLLDNHHVIDEQVTEIHRDLPWRYYRALPKLLDPDWRGLPRVYHLACDFISHTDGIVDAETLAAYIRGYQSKTVLKIGELWAVPIMLRLALVENLRRLSQSALRAREYRLIAEKFCQDTIEGKAVAGSEMLVNLASRFDAQPDLLKLCATHIVRRLRAKGSAAALALQWLYQKLQERGVDVDELTRSEQQSQAADQISFGNSITALKTIGSLNWREWFEKVSLVDEILRADPSGVYVLSDFVTRDMYRHRIERIARRLKRPETEVAERLIAHMSKEEALEAASSKHDSAPDRSFRTERLRHIGYFLIDAGRKEFEKSLGLSPDFALWWGRFARENAFRVYAFAVIAATALLCVAAISVCEAMSLPFVPVIILAALYIFPASEAAIQLVQWLVNRLVAPRPLPKLDFEKGIPDWCRTAVVVQTICADKTALERLAETLEIRFLGNDDQNLMFGILADLPDAPRETLPGDRGLVSHASELIRNLNQRYCKDGRDRFFVLFRRRIWNASEQKFMGWERKRGKIMEFNRLLRGATNTSFDVIVGDLDRLRSSRYVITLDNDTQLPASVARKLIGTIAHPLNRAQFSETTNVVVDGYGVIQPRVGITLQSAVASRFAALFCGQVGLDPYTKTVSDVYQDLFREGSYIGKGIYEIDAFERALRDRVPENALLSHDLFEGTFARVGLASDIEFFDEFPSRYHAFMRREHRWIRGDWQLLPWTRLRVPHALGARYRSPLSWLSWWKLVDNLRRSLVAPAVMLLLVAAWLHAPGSAVTWTAIVVATWFIPLALFLLSALVDFPFGYSLSVFAKSFFRDLKRIVIQLVFQLLTVPQQAWTSVHAIFVTLYRLLRSKRNLLEWETAHAAERRLGSDLASFLRFMSPAVAGAGIVCVLLLQRAEVSLISYCFVALWATSPLAAWALSLPRERIGTGLRGEDERYLRQLAFHTWRYFDTFLVPEYNFLIPDNLQVVPSRVVAERTSPTNISLSLLSVVSSFDLGFIAIRGAVRRLTGTIDALKKFERFHGHFVNWCEIRTLRPLPPRYVSTVDSGNLAGHFIALQEALKEMPHAPLMSAAHVRHLRGLVGEKHERISSVLDGMLEKNGLQSLKDFMEVLGALEEVEESMSRGHASPELVRLYEDICELKVFVDWTAHISLLKRLSKKKVFHRRLEGIDRILVGRPPTVSLLLKLVRRLKKLESIVVDERLEESDREELGHFQAALDSALTALEAIAYDLQRLSADLGQFVREMDFRFLFDTQKKLMVIGYNIDTGHADNSYYDLLASEARLASIIAIAKGDLPQSHWFVLNRSLVDSDGGKALVSWSGTMFEYLMPLLVMKDFPGTLLSETYQTVVAAQRRYARRRGVPWGVSESAYSGVDFEKTYQYRAFGIPGLGLKRGLSADLVVSPYSSALALMIDARAAVSNLRELERLGVRGEFGFYEAVDFTKERLGADEATHVVKSFLAHHQGMSLIAINNVINDGIFQRRFHASPLLRATELLLQERFPSRVPLLVPHEAELSLLEREESEARAERSERMATPHTAMPRMRVLSNGRYSVLLDNAGCGYSFFDGETCLTACRLDALSGGTGTFVYVRDVATGGVWSTTYQPTRSEPEDYEVIFNPDKVEYRRRDQGVSVHTEVTVSPEDNVEVRRVTITNTSGRLRVFEVTSYGEVALASRAAHRAHPAFSKLFISSEFIRDHDTLVFSRRPRSSGEKPVFMFHSISMPVVWEPVQCETSRENFLGRGRSASNPRAVELGGVLSGTVGPVLDPIFSLRTRVEIEPGSSQQVVFLLGAAENRDQAINLSQKYRESQHVARAFELAWSRSDVEIRNQQFTIRQGHAFQHLAGCLLANHERLRAPSGLFQQNRLSQQALWRLGVSGDEAIVLVKVRDPEHMKLARETVLAHEYLRLRGVRFDLVILNYYAGGYLQNVHEDLDLLLKAGSSRDFIDKRGGVFLRARHHLSDEEDRLLNVASRVILDGEKGSLATQLRPELKRPSAPLTRRQASLSREGAYSPPHTRITHGNGIGGFTPHDHAYQMVLSADALPPLPWSNVVANPRFGFLVTESGSGFTWAENSRENRLSSWSNDPVSDPFSEVLYIRDIQSGQFWSPTPRPVFHGEKVVVTHGFGYSQFDSEISELRSSLIVSGSKSEKVKWWHLELQNVAGEERSFELFLYVDWVLGVHREETSPYLVSSYDEVAQTLTVRNPFNIDFSSQVVFMGSSHPVHSFTTDRAEFIGRHGDASSPGALELAGSAIGLGSLLGVGRSQSLRLSGRVGGGFESAGVVRVQVTLAPKEKRAVLFYIGQTESESEVRSLAARYRSLTHWASSFDEVKAHWKQLTHAVQVQTPEKSFDTMANGWLLYQTVSSRMWGRTGFYQSSGALGFRDQLQDCMALLIAKPSETRAQILLHAGRQFVEGDVQHWWHPPTGRGIRSRISDNYLWLPFVLLQYLEATGDESILDEQISFIEGPPLGSDEHDHYFTPQPSAHRASLYEHVVIALDRALSLLGARGIPLMGSGDWNDGMNAVGIHGRGESVWLGWFVAGLLVRFSGTVERRRDNYRAQEYREKAGAIVSAIESHAWDGDWYLRAFFDDGTPMGSARSAECRIDSLAQSWSVISGLGNPDRQRAGMEAVYRELVRGEDGLIRLLWPPFHESVPSPGYIQGYPRGLRENGGQYTHAAAWVILATALRGHGSLAMRLFQLINPIERSRDKEALTRYKTEPYVMCGDVYSVAPHVGRGGWSWYTGSSGWLYRIAVEHIVGLKVRSEYFVVEPCIPGEWKAFSFTYHRDGVTYRVSVRNPEGVETGVVEVRVGGEIIADQRIGISGREKGSLVDVHVTMGKRNHGEA